PLPRQRLNGAHVDLVEIGALLAIDLDVHEVRVHVRRDRGILEALVLHHMAPMAGAVADGEKDRAIETSRGCQGLLSPGKPVDRVAGMLEEVWAGLAGEAVLAGGRGARHDVAGRGRSAGREES